MRRSLFLFSICLLTLPLYSRTLTLQECRDLALGAASSQSAEQLQLAAEANRKAAYPLPAFSQSARMPSSVEGSEITLLS